VRYGLLLGLLFVVRLKVSFQMFQASPGDMQAAHQSAYLSYRTSSIIQIVRHSKMMSEGSVFCSNRNYMCAGS
jgi:hypothetical protein